MVRPTIATSTKVYPLCTYNSNLSFFSKKLQCLRFLKECHSMRQLYQVHAQIQISGLYRNMNVVHELIQFCALHPSGSLTYAHIVVENYNITALSLWNNLIRSHATRNSSRGAVLAFLAMRGGGIRPNKLTYPFLFKACAAISSLREGKQAHIDAMKRGLDSDVYICNTLIHFYGSCREIDDACRVFDEMLVWTIVSWNSIIFACIENLRLWSSVELFFEMRDRGFDPDETSMVGSLSACAEMGNLSLGRWVHSQVVEKGLPINCELGTSLVNMYAKCGDLNSARSVFAKMMVKNVWTWSAMILGLAQHGFAQDALKLFKKMKSYRIQPNHVTFLGVLCACSHAQLVEDGQRFFHEMQREHGIKPTLSHYGAMVDCFSRAGHLKEAYSFVVNMPIKPDAIVWRTLLSACYIHDANDYIGVAEKVRKRLLEMEPRRSGNYVMVANQYAEVGMWEKVELLKSNMRDIGLKKVVAESFVQVGGSMHKFISGGGCQGPYEGIYLLLDKLNLHMKMVNYDLSS